MTDTKVAGYATKAAEITGTLDRRITPADQLAALRIREHPRRLIRTCLHLAQIAGLEDLRLGQWAHMLGFRGHFSTKSRRYSVTLTALRNARTAYQRQQAPGLMPEPTDDTTLVIAHWAFAGRGHPCYQSPAPRALPLDRPPGSESSWT